MNFEVETVVHGLNQPVAAAFLPDESMLILEKGGQLLRAEQLDLLPVTPQPYMTITDIVTTGEHGLMSIALDPDFAVNGFFYLYYSSASTGRFRISRFWHHLDHAHLANETVIWESPETTTNCCHFGGGLSFGPDGMLYLATGEDFQGGQAQDLTRPGGKIIRLNPDGTIPLDNPFVDGPGGNLDEIWALGLRNPFRATWDLPTERFLIADVGSNLLGMSMEELNLGLAGANYGWPFCEGPCDNPNFPQCDCDLHESPIFSYPHGQQGAAIIGGPVYRGEQFPDDFVGAYFYGDYVRGSIRYLEFDENGAVTGDFPFDSNVGDVVSLHVGTDGFLYAVAISGTVSRYLFNDGNQAPVITQASADVVSGLAPLTVQFTGAATDAESDELTFRWVFGDGNEAFGAEVSHTYTANGVYDAVLYVSDGLRTRFSNPIRITVGVPPVVSLDAPLDGSLFRAGDAVVLTGSATSSDGDLTDDSYRWSVVFLHNEHTHPVFSDLVGPNGVLNIPLSDHDYSGFTGYEITLTVTDTGGLSTAKSVRIYPDKVNLTFDTVPSGLTFLLDTLPRTTPFVYDTLIGIQHTVSAAGTECLDGVDLTFASWSHGQPAEHVLVVPETDAAFTATYNGDLTPPECSLLYREDFESYAVGQDPAGWLDSAAGNSLLPGNEFQVLAVDGTQALGTLSTQVNLHSHYADSSAYAWGSQEITGRMRYSDAGGGIGLTFFSDFPNSDRYYRLRRGDFHLGREFHIFPHGTPVPTGTTAVSFLPVPNQWYRFRLQVEDTGLRTNIRVRMWPQEAAEPAGWQIDCFDDTPTRLTEGTIGVWTMGAGGKYWDDLEVHNLLCSGSLPDCDDGNVCNGVETCQDGVCLPGEPLVCGDGNLCTGSGSCDPVLGCMPGDPLDCDDGNVCNGIETCDPDVGCVAGTPLACDDGNICNGIETCDPIEGCLPGEPLSCDPGDLCSGLGSCDPVLGCVIGDPLECDDSDVCNGIETCDPIEGCIPGEPLACDDGNICNGVETCDPIEGCIPGEPLSCDDGNICNGIETCDPVEGCVAGEPLLCDDGNACNGIETCDPIEGCLPGEPLICDDENPCTVNECDPLEGCVFTPIPGCQTDIQVVPVVTTIDPAGTPATANGDLPASAAMVESEAVYWVELWATDAGAINTGITSLYVNFTHCPDTEILALGHDEPFSVLSGGNLVPNGVEEFGGSALPHGGGVEPQWVRIGWLRMLAPKDMDDCLFTLHPSVTGVGAFGRGLIPWHSVELGTASASADPNPDGVNYDLDGDGFIGAGDLSLFAACWQCNDLDPCWSENGCTEKDYDCDGQVGPGDFAWFVTAWQKNVDDPTIEYPRCPTVLGGINGNGDPVARLVLVSRTVPSTVDSSILLPLSTSAPLKTGDTVHVEVWLRDDPAADLRLTSAYVDLAFSRRMLRVTENGLTHGSVFGMFKSGQAAAGRVRNLGGSRLAVSNAGPATWVRLATVKMEVLTPIYAMPLELLPGSIGMAAYAHGLLMPTDVSFTGTTLTGDAPPPTKPREPSRR